MPFIALIIGIFIVLVLVGIALFFGLIGAVQRGPKPSEGKKSSG